jgi:hypothetical protein
VLAPATIPQQYAPQFIEPPFRGVYELDILEVLDYEGCDRGND